MPKSHAIGNNKGTANLRNLTITKNVGAGEVYELRGVKLVNSNLSIISYTFIDTPLPPVVNLINVDIDKGSTIFFQGTAPPPFAFALNFSGNSVNCGTINTVGLGGYRGDNLETDINIRGIFTNNGNILDAGNSNTKGTVVLDASADGAKLVNNGLIESGALTKISIATIGTGTLAFIPPFFSRMGFPDGGVLDIEAPIGSGQTVDMTNDGVLTIGDLHDFHATIKGFSGPHVTLTPTDVSPGVTSDRIGLPGNVTGTSYHGTARSGDLTLLSGSQHVGSLHLAGDYRAATFSVVHGTLTMA